jgi:2-hydroxycyclohexanecarboxyl-CoA dehydrogenase
MTEAAKPRVAFVTGGAGGIGKAICAALAARGCRVAVADLPSAAIADTTRELGGLAVALDVTDPVSVLRAVAETTAGLGPIDVCVNCAGWDELRPFVATDEEFQRRVLEINLGGPMRVLRAVLPGMLERRWGRIVNIASDAGRVGSSLEAIYSAAKGGLVALTKTLARETARAGVTANSVCPGPTATPMLQRVAATSTDAEKVIASMTRAVPMKRLGTPADVAAAVAYLCSEEAGYVTGQTLSVSGGLTMV